MKFKETRNPIPLHVYNINNNCFADTVIIILSIYLRCTDLNKTLLNVSQQDSKIDKNIKKTLKALFDNIFNAVMPISNVKYIQTLRNLFKEKYNKYLNSDNHIDLDSITTCDNFLVFILMTLEYFSDNRPNKIYDNIGQLNINITDLFKIRYTGNNYIKSFIAANEILTKDMIFLRFQDLDSINNFFPDLKHNPKIIINDNEYSIVGIIMRSENRSHYTVKYLNPITNNVEFFDDTYYINENKLLNLMPLKTDFSNNDLDNFFQQTQTSLVFLIKSKLLPQAKIRMQYLIKTD